MKDLKILIAEDDTASQMLLRIILMPFGKEIIIANNGVEAVETCRNQPDIDLVLMDIKMPVMNGLEATKQIRTFNKNLVIIAQTAFAERGNKENAFALGFNDYISKPISKRYVKDLIQKHFN